jgi:hypothetical protein
MAGDMALRKGSCSTLPAAWQPLSRLHELDKNIRTLRLEIDGPASSHH